MKNKFVVLLFTLLVAFGGSIVLAGDEFMSHEVTGFSLGVASDEAFLVTKQDKKMVQYMVDKWQDNEDYVLVITGFADATEWKEEKLDDALNPGIALGRSALGLNLVKNYGAIDETRIMCFVRECDSIGPEFRGFEIKLINSSWVSISEFYKFRIEMDKFKKKFRKGDTFLFGNLEALNFRLEELELRPASSSGFETRLGFGISSTPFETIPTFYGAVGSNSVLFEGEVGHSINSHVEKINGENVDCHVSFIACRTSMEVFNLVGFDTRLSAGWFWTQNYPIKYLGYYQKYSGPEVGLSFTKNDFILGLNLSGNIYWNPAQINNYPKLTNEWDNSNFRLSFNLNKSFGDK